MKKYLFLLMILYAAASVWGQAITYTHRWTGNVNRSWNTTGNWDRWTGSAGNNDLNDPANWAAAGSYPGATSNVFIPAFTGTFTYTYTPFLPYGGGAVTFTDTVVITDVPGSRSGGIIQSDGNLVLYVPGGSFTINNGSDIQSHGSLTIDDVINFSLVNGDIQSHGAFSVLNGRKDGTNFTQSGGTIVSDADIFIILDSGNSTFTQSNGTIESDGEIRINIAPPSSGGSFVQEAGGTITSADNLTINMNNIVSNVRFSGEISSDSDITINIENNNPSLIQFEGTITSTNGNISLFTDKLPTMTGSTLSAGNAFQLAPANVDSVIEYAFGNPGGTAVWYSSDWAAAWPAVNAQSYIIGRAAHKGNINLHNISNAPYPFTVINSAGTGTNGTITILDDYSSDDKMLTLHSGSGGVVLDGGGGNASINLGDAPFIATGCFTLNNIESGAITATGVYGTDEGITLGGGIAVTGSGDKNLTLDAGTKNITITGNTGTNTDTVGTMVIKSSGTITLNGNTFWNNLSCETPGAIIKFSNHTDSHTVKGTFKIKSSDRTKPITLTRLTDNPPPAIRPITIDGAFWHFIYETSAEIDFDNVIVRYSFADRQVTTESGNVMLGSCGTQFNVNWGSDKSLLIYSYVEDFDRNGKIDRIRVQSSVDITDDFSGLVIEVKGYTVKHHSYYEKHTSRPSDFYIPLEEKNYPDAGASPEWRIVSNTTLKPILLPPDNVPFGPTDWIVPVDTTWPMISYALMLPEYKELFVKFTKPVTGISDADIKIDGHPIDNTPITGVYHSEYVLSTADITFNVSELHSGLKNFTIDDPAALHDQKTITFSPALIAEFGSPSYPDDYTYAAYTKISLEPAGMADTTHRLTDVLVSVPGSDLDRQFVWPVYAKDESNSMLSNDDVMGIVRDFSGKGNLRGTDITIQANVNSILAGTTPKLIYALNVPGTYKAKAEHGPVGLWLPDDVTLVPEKYMPNLPVPGTRVASSNNFDFKLLGIEYEADDTLEFFFKLNPGPDDISIARLDGPPDSPNWYRSIKPFSFGIKDVVFQRGGATILNNVINPTRGEKTYINYTLKKCGQVTVQVFTMDGNLVQVLQRGSQSPGEYIKSWDGKNQGGRSVARGMYFIRIVGPEIDEIRKVMVIK